MGVSHPDAKRAHWSGACSVEDVSRAKSNLTKEIYNVRPFMSVYDE